MNTLQSKLEFEQEIRESIEESARIGYHPSRFIKMLQDSDAISVAKKIVASGELQDGFKKLKALDRLDLALESIMLKPEFSKLFTKQELKAAKWRLDQVKRS